MPHNLLKVYNALLELDALSEKQRISSLKGVFNRDVVPGLIFNKKIIKPTTADGEDSMERLFRHLTTVITDHSINKRKYDRSRSIRLHWLKYHILENKKENMYIFSVKEPAGNRTYIYDKEEEYVIVLEPLRNVDEYYLLTAYHIEGKDAARDKMMKKYKRRLPDIL
ncbi:MAG: hypothetical protein UE068_08625 [Paludibacteraceae bacterium]|nr:hypothetical protein [Paludibacteraceae bacterium]